jgi:thiamine-monophosphate kinase
VNEFELIDRYFRDSGVARSDVKLGVGDDAALLESPAGQQLVAAIDTLVEGRHFPSGSMPASIGHRGLAVNLSDFAAMGAVPTWALLALTLPEIDEPWVAQFASGFSSLARAHGVRLVGGDTTAGPLTVTVQLLGHVPPGKAMLRAGGSAGDILFVSGTPGDSAAGLALEQGALEAGVTGDAERYLRERFLFPTPRVELGQYLRAFASACIDVSDGLFGDASRLASASGCGMRIFHEQIPVSAQLIAVAGEERACHYALTGGEDYELCFAVPPERLDSLERTLPRERWRYQRIGELTASAQRSLIRDGNVIDFSHAGFDHFAGV